MAHLINGLNTGFALRISQSRLNAKLTQEELAGLVNIDKRSISQYENGHMFPRGPIIKRLAEHMRVDAAWLATGNDEKTSQYYAAQRPVNQGGLEKKMELLYIEEWKSLSFERPPYLRRYSATPRYDMESAVIEDFVPVSKTFYDQFRATRYPGTFPDYPGCPAGSILIYDGGPTVPQQINGGDFVIFRFRGQENEPGLRRLFREPGVSGEMLVAIDPSMPASPIPLDPVDIEILGVVIWQVIQRQNAARILDPCAVNLGG